MGGAVPLSPLALAIAYGRAIALLVAQLGRRWKSMRQKRQHGSGCQRLSSHSRHLSPCVTSTTKMRWHSAINNVFMTQMWDGLARRARLEELDWTELRASTVCSESLMAGARAIATVR